MISLVAVSHTQVSALAKVEQARGAFNASVLRSIVLQVRTPCHNFHAESLTDSSHSLAQSAQSDKTKRPALEIVADGPLPSTFAHSLILFGDPPSEGKQELSKLGERGELSVQPR